MTTLNRAIKWYINGDLPGGRNALLDGLTANPINLKPSLMQGDALLIHLYFRAPGAVGSATTAVSLAAGYTLYLVGKVASAIGTGSVLFNVSDWTDGEDYYQGTLNLNTAAINAAFAAESGKDAIDVSVDIEYRDAGNTERVTYRADIQLCRQVYQGTEAAPTPSVVLGLESPSGYVFRLSISDEGVLSQERVS